MTDEKQDQKQDEKSEPAETTGDPGILASLLPEQLEQCRSEAEKLVKGEPDVNMAVQIMITARRLYSLGRYALHELFESRDIGWEAGIEQLLIESAMAAGNARYDVEVLLRSMNGPVASFLQSQISIMQAQQKTSSEVDMVEAKSQLMSLPVPTVVAGTEMELKRGELVVVHGSRDEISSQFDLLAEKALESSKEKSLPCGVIHFRGFPELGPADHDSDTYVRLGFATWQGAANSSTRLLNSLLPRLRRLNGRFDLLLIEDLPSGRTQGFAKGDRSLSPRARAAADLLLKVCKKHAIACVCGIPIPVEANADRRQGIIEEIGKRFEGTTIVEAKVENGDS